MFNVSIKPINLTLTIEPQVYTYGDNIDIQASKYTLTEGLLEDEKLDLLFVSETFENVAGTYPITATNSNKNYYVTVMPSTIVINPRELTLIYNGVNDLTFKGTSSILFLVNSNLMFGLDL